MEWNLCLVVVFPVISAVVAALCAIVIGRDALSKPRPDKYAWFIAFAMFALAAGADAAGRELGWTEWLARTYYMTGPALVVAFLAIGELYLLFPGRMGRFAPGATILLTAVWVTLVLNAPIDSARLGAEGWEAIDRSGALRIASISINSVGTTIIVGGLLWSIWRFQRTGRMRNRMIGCIFIVTGTISVAMGGTLTRFGHYEYLYIAMSFGIVLIFTGVLWTRRPETVTARVGSTESTPTQDVVAVEQRVPVRADPELAEELAFLVETVLPREAAEIRDVCASWSVETDDSPVMPRDVARRAWRLRTNLPAQAQQQFDALGVPERRAIVELAAEVLQFPGINEHPDATAMNADAPQLRG